MTIRHPMANGATSQLEYCSACHYDGFWTEDISEDILHNEDIEGADGEIESPDYDADLYTCFHCRSRLTNEDRFSLFAGRPGKGGAA